MYDGVVHVKCTLSTYNPGKNDPYNYVHMYVSTYTGRISCENLFVDCFTGCLLFISQRTPGYDLPARKCTEESRCEERGPRGHLHAYVPTGCSSDAGMYSDWSYS